MAEGKRAANRRRHETAIIETAETMLASHGPGGLTLRGVAAEVGLAPSAIYRYYPGIDALLTALILRAYHDSGQAAMDAAAATAGEGPRERLLAVAGAVRQWALANPHRYALIYGTPIPGYQAPPDTVPAAAMIGLALSRVLTESGLELAGDPRWRTMGVDPEAAAGLGLTPALLPGAIGLWARVFGLVSLELFGHFHGVIDEPEAYFAAMLNREVDLLLGAEEAQPS